MRPHLPLLALSLLLPACAMERSASLTAPPVGAKTVRLCATVDEQLRDFSGWIDPATGDTLVAGRRFRDQFPSGYAEGKPWYEPGKPGILPHERDPSWSFGEARILESGDRMITRDRIPFWPYGKPRTLESGDLREPGLKRISRLGDVDIYATRDMEAIPAKAGEEEGFWQYEIVYVPTHPGCVFQPYRRQHYHTGGVRG
jgi:hypothetical protein